MQGWLLDAQVNTYILRKMCPCCSVPLPKLTVKVNETSDMLYTRIACRDLNGLCFVS